MSCVKASTLRLQCTVSCLELESTMRSPARAQQREPDHDGRSANIKMQMFGEWMTALIGPALELNEVSIKAAKRLELGEAPTAVRPLDQLQCL